MTELITDPDEACRRFIDHLIQNVADQASGRSIDRLDERPDGVFWLGRLATEDSVLTNRFGDRGERLDPCATGLVLRLDGAPPWRASISASMAIWTRADSKSPSFKQRPPEVTLDVDIPIGSASHGSSRFANAFAAINESDRSARVDTDVVDLHDGTFECAITLVNDTPEGTRGQDPVLYETELTVTGLTTLPFELDALPDSFRYDRRVDAYGVNCGVEQLANGFRTSDLPVADVGRPKYWNSPADVPDISFAQLAIEPFGPCEALAEAFDEWRASTWSTGALKARATKEGWSEEMLSEARKASDEVTEESRRIHEGLDLLRSDPIVRQSFMLMNEAMVLATARKGFSAWRPFQIGFLLANLASVADAAAEADVADIVWFATGGGKTETYLGLLLSAAFHDRLTGKLAGTTAWSRFPLRMLSLQQTQRFADAFAAAELVRQRHEVPGDEFSVGFLVGGAATPNRIPLEPAHDGEPNVEDDDMPAGYKVLSKCPFCGADTNMQFDRVAWTLDHMCAGDDCPWGDRALPFRIVDDEIYRFLPTVVVGTVDKVANVAMQASMRGLVVAPHGRCDRPGHGYTYASRSARKNGCLVPGCQGRSHKLDAETRGRIAPTFRLQDELHLMRDSLGAVDSHYEGLLDHLLESTSGRRSKILASSATLSGYERQVGVVYQREARVFPQPPPAETDGFWSCQTDTLARRFVAVAPRGATIEYAIDRLLSELQQQVRVLNADPAQAEEFGVDPSLAPMLVDLYGVDVVYGNTLRDLDAVVRSTETQLRVDGQVNTATLTGGTNFDIVRQVLDRLDEPEPDFADRVHVVAASSMMSHGVDIDRLNVMAMYGLPLATAEFIQATARVGRRHPALVFVLHKIARERDASVFRNFGPFVRQGDRFVDPVPVTRHSRRVLARTLPGLEIARLLQIIEPEADQPLATVRKIREYFEAGGFVAATEVESLIDALGFDRAVDSGLRDVIEQWVERFMYNVEHPPPEARFASDLCPGSSRPMLSLRDVEEQVPVIGLMR